MSEPDRDAPLRRGSALADRVIFEWVVDAPVLVGIDDTGESQEPGTIDLSLAVSLESPSNR